MEIDFNDSYTLEELSGVLKKAFYQLKDEGVTHAKTVRLSLRPGTKTLTAKTKFWNDTEVLEYHHPAEYDHKQEDPKPLHPATRPPSQDYIEAITKEADKEVKNWRIATTTCLNRDPPFKDRPALQQTGQSLQDRLLPKAQSRNAKLRKELGLPYNEKHIISARKPR